MLMMMMYLVVVVIPGATTREKAGKLIDSSGESGTGVDIWS
jgi:hypothetical protein